MSESDDEFPVEVVNAALLMGHFVGHATGIHPTEMSSYRKANLREYAEYLMRLRAEAGNADPFDVTLQENGRRLALTIDREWVGFSGQLESDEFVVRFLPNAIRLSRHLPRIT